MKFELQIEYCSDYTQLDLEQIVNLLEEDDDIEVLNSNISISENHDIRSLSEVDIFDCLIKAIIDASTASTINILIDVIKLRLWPKIRSRLLPNNIHTSVLITIEGMDDGGEKIQLVFDTDSSLRTLKQKFTIDLNRTYAVLIGNGEYKHGIDSISQVKNNLSRLHQLLKDKRHIGLPKENVIVLHDKTCDEISKVLFEVSKKEGIETLLIYYVGHGFYNKSDNYFLAAHDTYKIEDIIQSGINREFIEKEILNKSLAKQKIVIIDACFSGFFALGDKTLRELDVKGTFVLTSSTKDSISLYSTSQSYTFFTDVFCSVIENGISNDRPLLSLEDIYTQTKVILSEKGLPVPIRKSNLSINSDDFYIAQNPKFSIELVLENVKKNIHAGMFSEAEKILLPLMKDYPANSEIGKVFSLFISEKNFSELIKEGDRLFYGEKRYGNAINKYREATKIKRDSSVEDKIRDCTKAETDTGTFSNKALTFLSAFILLLFSSFIANWIKDNYDDNRSQEGKVKSRKQEPTQVISYVQEDTTIHIKPSLPIDPIKKESANIKIINEKEIEHFISKENLKYGFRKKETPDIVLISPKYDDAEDFKEGVALVKKDDLYGYINSEGKEVIDYKFQKGRSFSEGLAVVKYEGKFGYINRKGFLIISNIYDFADDFKGDSAQVKIDNDYFYIDKTGERKVASEVLID